MLPTPNNHTSVPLADSISNQADVVALRVGAKSICIHKFTSVLAHVYGTYQLRSCRFITGFAGSVLSTAVPVTLSTDHQPHPVALTIGCLGSVLSTVTFVPATILLTHLVYPHTDTGHFGMLFNSSLVANWSFNISIVSVSQFTSFISCLCFLSAFFPSSFFNSASS